MKLILAISLICLRCAAIDDQRAVEAIIGEAAGQTITEKLAVAGAIRNRGTLDGVRGRHNMGMVSRQPAWVWTDARTAWAQSATNDLSNGATHWESDNFNRPAWSVGMTLTAHVGKFKFYRP